MVEKEPEASAPSSVTEESCDRAKASFKVQCHTVKTPISTRSQQKELRARQLKASTVCVATTRRTEVGPLVVNTESSSNSPFGTRL